MTNAIFMLYFDCKLNQPATSRELMKSIIEGKLSVAKAAELLGLHPQTVRDGAREGRIPAFCLNGRYFFDPAELETLLTRVVPTEKPKNDKTIKDLN